MSKYYIVRGSSDAKIIGIRDGGSQAEIDRSGFKDKSNYDRFIEHFFTDGSFILNQERLESIPDFEVRLEFVRLATKAKLTSFVDYSPQLYNAGKFLVDARALQIITGYNLPRHKIYSAEIYDRETVHHYNLLYCPPLPFDVIDFTRSVFYTGSPILGKKKFSLRNEAEFKALKADMLFSIDTMAYNEKFPIGLDYFYSRLSLSDLFISERLKNALLEAGVSGLNIIEAKDPYLLFST